MGKIPTVAFDPNRHVLVGRENVEGREAFFTLASIVDAERPLEAQHEAVALDELRSQVAELRASQFANESIVALIKENTPPAALTQETMTVLTEMTKAQLQHSKRLAELESKVSVLASTLIKISERIAV